MTTENKHGGNFRKHLERAYDHGWEGCEQDFIDASANLNPLGPPPWINEVIFSSLELLSRYPDPAYTELSRAAANYFFVSPERIVFSNGADEVMFALARALAKKATGTVCAFVAVPAYSSYREALSLAGFTVNEVPYQTLLNNLNSKIDTLPCNTCWIGAPNNPDGVIPPEYPQCVIEYAKRFPQTNFVIDEAFIEFTDYPSLCEIKSIPDNIFIIRSMTKIFAVPGLRIGFAVVPESYKHLIQQEIPNWPLNTIAEQFALAAFTKLETQAFITSSKQFIRDEMQRIRKALSPYYELSEAQANFYCIGLSSQYFAESISQFPSILERISNSQPAQSLSELAISLEQFFYKNGIAVRDVSNYSHSNGWNFRIAIRTQKENDRIISTLIEFAELTQSSNRKTIMHSTHTHTLRPNVPQRAKAIMIQGCSSSAGKSTIAAALCRILRNRGFDVAPYKAQNMSNNSAVTNNGFEIGRAQAVQAMACGLEPDPRMNPVLIKPEGNMESQVIVMGKPWQRKSALDYYKQKKELAAIAQAAYDSLADEHEIIILEGAGSPAEINLKLHDFVNMEAAIHADADVYLVGDIDRGGVFASFLGHIATFTPYERNLLKGYIINKFRGDVTLLTPAYEMLAQYTSIPVLGCVPYFHDILIPEEDETKFIPVQQQAEKNGIALNEITLGIIMYPHVSNFTDFEPFAYEPYVRIKKIYSPADSTGADAIMLPGSKTTVKDYLWLKETGLDRMILERAAQGSIIIGICGGLQMLGTEIHDPHHIESDSNITEALALLPLVTTFSSDKQLARGRYSIIKAYDFLKNETNIDTSLIEQLLIKLSQWEISGYEIHHGSTLYLETSHNVQTNADSSFTHYNDKKPLPFIFNANNYPVAWCYKNIIGTYLHGIFENDEFRTAIINCIRAQKQLQEQSIYPVPTTDTELEKLSNFITAYIDIDTILNNSMKQTTRKAYQRWS